MGSLVHIPAQRSGWATLRSRLDHLSVVTWAVPPERLARLIPPPLTLETITLGGASRALVSAVTFQNRGFGPVWSPLPGMTLGQTNYRVYVRCPASAGATRGVFFVGTTIDTRFVVVPRRLWGMPWRRAHYRFCVERTAHSSGLEVEAKGAWSMRLRLGELRPIAGPLPGFKSVAEGMNLLTQPWVGFYAWGGGLGRYSVWHAPYEARVASVSRAEFSLLDTLGIVPFASQEDVHSVIFASSSAYRIYLPPRRWAARSGASLSSST